MIKPINMEKLVKGKLSDLETQVEEGNVLLIY